MNTKDYCARIWRARMMMFLRNGVDELSEEQILLGSGITISTEKDFMRLASDFEADSRIVDYEMMKFFNERTKNTPITPCIYREYQGNLALTQQFVDMIENVERKVLEKLNKQ
jgi:hypothetical protein